MKTKLTGRVYRKSNDCVWFVEIGGIEFRVHDSLPIHPILTRGRDENKMVNFYLDHQFLFPAVVVSFYQ